MTEKQLYWKICNAYTKAGSYRALAKQWGVTAAYLCDLVKKRRTAGPKILRHFGLKRKIILSSVLETQ